MKNKLLLFGFLSVLSPVLFGQSFLGGHFSTKEAILSNTLNPATGIAGDMKWQVNLLGLSTEVGNNYFYIKEFKGIAKGFDQDQYIGEKLDGKTKEMHVNMTILGPSGFVRIKKDNAITFGTRVRATSTFNDMNEDLVYSLYHNFQDILQWAPSFTDERAAAAVNVYSEIYAGYARSIKLADRHSLHLALNVKMNNNMFNAQFETDNLDFHKVYTSATDSFINVGNTTFDLLVSDVIDDGYKFKFGVNGFGFDFGAIYEFKMKNSNEHFIMAGLALNDFGYNKYTLGKNSRTFVGNGKNVPAEHLVGTDGETIKLDDVLDSLGTKTIPTGTQKIKLPASLNFFVDVRVVKMFYINTNLQFNPYSFKKGTPVANLPIDITVTPRFENKLLSVFMPINYNEYSGFNMGVGLRIAQFTMGSSTIITSFAKKEFTGMDFYLNIGFGKSAKSKKETKTPEAPAPPKEG